MKKHLFRTVLCALIVVVSACSSEELVEQQTSSKQITMTASDFKCADGSRTSIDVTFAGGEFKWATNDTVGIFPNEGTQVAFPMISGAGTKTASFNGGGWALKPSSKYMAYYPIIGQFYLDKTAIPVCFDEYQVQTGNAPTAHLGKYDYMAAIAKIPQDINVNFEFKHLCALVELNIPVPQKGDLTFVVLSSKEAIFTTKGTIDLTSASPMITSVDKSKSIKVGLMGNNTSVDNETIKVYLMMAPIDLTGKTITATIVNNGVEHKGYLETDNLEAGIAYKLSVSLEEQKPVPPTQNVYHVAKAGTLPQLIGEENKFNITELKLTGELNGTDIRFLREMAGSDVNGSLTNGVLTTLDLDDTKIVEGGEFYFQESYTKYYTKNNTIGAYTFHKCLLLNIKLPHSVTSTGESAFSDCSSLTSMNIPNSVTSIGNKSFRNCSNLRSINIPNSVISIGNESFRNCRGLRSINIPNSVISIGNLAFYGCSFLTSIDIPNGVTSIGSEAFRYCSRLRSINIPNSVTSIGSYAFSGCSSLISINIPNSVTSIGKLHFEYCSSLISIDIPRCVTSIGDNAFRDCSSLKSIYIPNSVTSIGSNTFENCGSLTSINIPNSVTSIGKNAFNSCGSLTSINIPNSVTSIGSNTFDNCSSLTSINIPNSVTSIGKNAFNNCSSLRSIYIPNSVTSIGSNTFNNCSSLTSINIPNSVTSIGNNAFNNCSSLTSINIPSSVITLGSYAFEGCTSLTSIIVGKGRTILHTDWLSSAEYCKNVYLPSTLKQIRGQALCRSAIAIYCFAIEAPTLFPNSGLSKTCKFYVPKESVDKYKLAEVWKDYAANIFEIPEGVTEP